MGTNDGGDDDFALWDFMMWVMISHCGLVMIPDYESDNFCQVVSAIIVKVYWCGGTK